VSSLKPIYVLDQRVSLYQPDGGFRTSLDSVMLAAACPAKTGEHILDMGCGVGGAGFCVLRRVDGTRLTGVEIQADHVELARQNIDLNGMSGRATFLCSDIRQFKTDERFDHVICNPPYMDAGTHTPSPSAARAMANGHQDDVDIRDWVDVAFNNLQSNGTLTVIHRGDMVDKIILAMGKRFGATEIIPLWPHAGEAAKRVIVRSIKDRRSPATMHPGIVLHEADGKYTKRTDGILRDMEAI
jgi:tRNA1(Val) A37 N6-methylase TrmN6